MRTQRKVHVAEMPLEELERLLTAVRSRIWAAQWMSEFGTALYSCAYWRRLCLETTSCRPSRAQVCKTGS